jgi:hypothetical protein
MNDDPLQIGANALANSSRTAIARADLVAILSTGDGPAHLVRALFEDCSQEALERMARQVGMTRAQLRSAYRLARTRRRALNADMEADESLLSR